MALAVAASPALRPTAQHASSIISLVARRGAAPAVPAPLPPRSRRASLTVGQHQDSSQKASGGTGERRTRIGELASNEAAQLGEGGLTQSK